MQRSPHLRSLLALFAIAILSGCASAAPFSVATPGLEAMGEEEAWFFTPVDRARDALQGTSLRARIDNTMQVYEDELERARRAQGGVLNATLNVLGLLLPISGTASSIALSDPDDVQTVAVVAGSATTAILLLDLLLKPGAKSAAARECEAYLESALAVFQQRWGTDRTAVTGTDEEWTTYLTMRATLEQGRESACGGG